MDMEEATLMRDLEYHRRQQYEHRKKYTPFVLLRSNNPIIQGCLSDWQRGHCTWEECLIAMVMMLKDMNDNLLKQMLGMPQASQITLKEETK